GLKSRMELDSHANMPVVGNQAYFLAHTGESAEVKPYNPDYPTKTIPIVDAAIQYDCPYSDETCVFIIRNALYVPSLQINLLPPFVIREAGVALNETPKIQRSDPTEEDHSMFFEETGLRVPLSLWGIFSYFPCRIPTRDVLETCENVYLLTPNKWNPHSDSFAYNEESLLDWEGNVLPKKDRRQFMMNEVDLDPMGNLLLRSTMIRQTVS
ncbi:MAG: hypothetical protein AAF587_44810, partial [Bacteroidota bacterium]